MCYKLVSLLLVLRTTTWALPTPEDEVSQLPNVNLGTVNEINRLNHAANDVVLSALEDDRNVDVENTVREVEELLRKNQKLPRLTRGEILDILDNITRTDAQRLTRTRSGDQRAIMLVMPYSGNDAAAGNVQELFTKPPITHIVEDKDDEAKPATTKKPYVRRRPATKRTTTTSTVAPDATTTTSKPIPAFTRRRISKTTTSSTTTTTAAPTTRKPFNSEITESSSSTSTVKPFVYMKRRRISPKTTTTTTTSTTTNRPSIETEEPFKPIPRAPNHKYPSQDEEPDHLATYSHQGIRVVEPPQQFAKRATTKKPAFKPRPTKYQPAPTESFKIPTNLKHVVKDIDTLIHQNPNKDNDDFIPMPAPTTGLPMPPKENLEDLLAQLAALQQQQQSLTTTTKAPDFENVAQNLSPEMKDLLTSLGLLQDPKVELEAPPAALEPSYEIKPDSYAAFKPLPQASHATDDDMDDFLARFGLGRNAARSQKAIAFSKPHNLELDTDAVPDKFKDVLKDIGFTKDHLKGSAFQTAADRDKKHEQASHVFSPSETQYATKDELDKLNQLLGVIKQLEMINGSATEEDLKGIDLDNLKDLVGSLNAAAAGAEGNSQGGAPFIPLDEQFGPNPAQESPGLQKNEVKRQTSTTTAAPPLVVISATEQSKNAMLADLEASFGGNAEVTAATTTTTTEAPKRTGFYYLVDWNTFLDIDDQKGKRVNLRFQPTIGDPKRFLSVTVP